MQNSKREKALKKQMKKERDDEDSLGEDYDDEQGKWCYDIKNGQNSPLDSADCITKFGYGVDYEEDPEERPAKGRKANKRTNK